MNKSFKFLLILLIINFDSSFQISPDADKIYYSNKIVGFLSSGKVSKNCKEQFEIYKNALDENQLWALKMFDAAARFPSGILEGNLFDLGSYDECLNVKHASAGSVPITGKYCLNEVSYGFAKSAVPVLGNRSGAYPFPLRLQLAICAPNSCSSSELEILYRDVFGNSKINNSSCQSKDNPPKLGAGGIAVICFISILLTIIVLSTIYEAIVVYVHKGSILESFVHPLLVAFSILRNGKKLLSIGRDQKQIQCVEGVRVMSAIWIVLSHRYSIPKTLPMRNKLYLIEWIQNAGNMVIIQASIAVDTFLVISGMVVAYTYLVSRSKGDKFNILSYYTHRYLRLTPVLVVLILFYLTLFEYMGSGPVWPTTIRPLVSGCETNWWKALLYIQNYGNNNLCLGHSWYLSTDMQLFLLSPVLLILLTKWPFYGILLSGLLAFSSMGVSFYVGWSLDLNAFGMNDDINDYFNRYYYPTYNRAAPWFFGFILGYIVFKIKRQKEYSFNKFVVFALWMTVLAVLPACIFGGHHLLTDEIFSSTPNKLSNIFHIALVRPAWSVAVCLLIIACVSGNGGPVDWFLSLPVFQLASKLSYSLYLTHYPIIYLMSAQMRVTPVMSNTSQLHLLCGDVLLSLAISALFFLGIEAPIATIDRIIFKSNKSKS